MNRQLSSHKLKGTRNNKLNENEQTISKENIGKTTYI